MLVLKESFLHQKIIENPLSSVFVIKMISPEIALNPVEFRLPLRHHVRSQLDGWCVVKVRVNLQIAG